jgi:hypothetical protein
VQVKIARTVVLLLTLASCAGPARQPPAGSAPSTSGPPSTSVQGKSAPSAAAPVVADASASGSPSAWTAASAAPAGAPSRVNSAYPGCGQSIPPAALWDETSEGEVLDAIQSAKACAAEHGRRLLLEFVAPWCEDCQEMAKLDETDVVAATLRRRFERVRINVGKWDRHEALRNTFGVRALATYIVIDPKRSKELAKTTLEPITKKGQKLSVQQWAAWLQEH